MKITEKVIGNVFVDDKNKIATKRNLCYCFECECPEELTKIQTFVKEITPT